MALAAFACLVAALGISIPAAVAQPSGIGGTVTAEDTGQPLVGECVIAWTADTFEFVEIACTDDAGVYQFSTLQAGTGYRIQADRFGSYLGEWAFDKRSFDTADVITVPAVVDFALAPGVAIEGVVTDEDTGEPLEGVCIRASFADTSEFADIDCTNAEGNYALGVAPGFEYKVQARGTEDYAGEWAFDKPSEGEADRVTPPAVVDFALDRLGRFTGTLTMPDGTPPAFARVSVVSAVDEEDTIDSVTTDENGQWSIGVPPGSYKLRADSEPFVRWAFDAPDFESADALSIGSGEVVTVDMRFRPLGTISGRVTDAGSGQPIAGICVRVIDPEDESSPAEDRCTGADGRYAIGVPEGTYAIHFTSGDGAYVSEWFKDELRQQDADPLFVGSGAAVKANAVLQRGGKVTGFLVDPVTGAPLGMCVLARDPNTLELIESQRLGCTDPDGHYTITGLPTGSVLLYTGGDRHLRPPAWAPGVPTSATAKKYRVVSGQTTNAGQFAVPIGGIVRGRVTNQAGEPLAGIVFTPTGAEDRSGEGRTAVTDANGEYQLDGLSLAPIVPGVFDPSGVYGWQWVGGAADRTQATPVSLQSGQVTTMDFVLGPAARLVITVVDADGNPVPLQEGIEFSVLTTAGQVEIRSGFIPDGASSTTITGLPGSAVLLKILGEEVWYDRATSEATATPITLTAGETTAVNFRLPAG